MDSVPMTLYHLKQAEATSCRGHRQHLLLILHRTVFTCVQLCIYDLDASLYMVYRLKKVQDAQSSFSNSYEQANCHFNSMARLKQVKRCGRGISPVKLVSSPTTSELLRRESENECMPSTLEIIEKNNLKKIICRKYKKLYKREQ